MAKKVVDFGARNASKQDWTRFVLYCDRTGERLATLVLDRPVGPGESFTGTLTITLEN